MEEKIKPLCFIGGLENDPEEQQEELERVPEFYHTLLNDILSMYDDPSVIGDACGDILIDLYKDDPDFTAETIDIILAHTIKPKEGE